MRTIKTLQTEVDVWIKQHGVRYFSELTNLAILLEETGELSSHSKKGKNPSTLKMRLPMN